MSYYADPSVWVQRSWPGLAGATGEQMRTVGARFNLAKRYRMWCAPVPEKDKLNFSHCAQTHHFNGWKVEEKLVIESIKKLLTWSLFLHGWVVFYFVWDRQAYKHKSTVDTHSLQVFVLPCFLSLFPLIHIQAHNTHRHTERRWLSAVCACVCV